MYENTFLYNTLFLQISVILVEETGVPAEKQLTCRKVLTISTNKVVWSIPQLWRNLN